MNVPIWIELWTMNKLWECWRHKFSLLTQSSKRLYDENHGRAPPGLVSAHKVPIWIECVILTQDFHHKDRGGNGHLHILWTAKTSVTCSFAAQPERDEDHRISNKVTTLLELKNVRIFMGYLNYIFLTASCALLVLRTGTLFEGYDGCNCRALVKNFKPWVLDFNFC